MMNDDTSSSATEPLWTLRELASEAAIALSEADVDQHSGRVRDVPNARTIRYYTTLGLLDRPAEFKGRTAYYRRRHLLQLVAIKRLQARGRSLDTIQQELLNLPDAKLEALARLPGEAPAAPPPPPAPRRGAFWETAPAPLDPTPEPTPSSLPANGAASVIRGVRLDRDVTLLLDGLSRELDASDLEAIQVAAAPLLKLLTARRLRGASNRDE